MILLFTSFLLFSCNNGANIDDSRKSYGYLMNKPDNELSSDEQKIKSKIGDIFFNNSKVENNMIILSFGKEDFKKVGIPEKYYEYVKEDIDNFNNDSNLSDVDIKEIFNQSKAEFEKSE